MKNEQEKEIDFISENLDITHQTETSFNLNPYKSSLKEVAQIDGFLDYLKITMAADIKRYFIQPVEAQANIKGAYFRTKYIYDLLVKMNNESLTKK